MLSAEEKCMNGWSYKGFHGKLLLIVVFGCSTERLLQMEFVEVYKILGVSFLVASNLGLLFFSWN